MEGRETYRFATRTLAQLALGVDRAGRPDGGRHRPLRPAPGEHPDHRVGGQGPRAADGQDVREPGQVRQHVGCVGADRPGRGGQRRPHQGGRPRRASSRSVPASRLARSRSSGRRTRPTAAARWPSGRGTSTSGCRRTESLTPRCRRPSARSRVPCWQARIARATSGWTLPLTADAAAANGNGTGPKAARRRDRSHREVGRRDRRLARDRPGDRAAPRRAGRRRRVQLPRQRSRRRPPTPRQPSRSWAVGPSPTRATSRSRKPPSPGRGRDRRVRQGRHPGQQRRHHARRPDHADERRGVARGPRDEPVRRVLRDQGRHAADAQGPRAAGSSTSPASPARPATPGRPTIRPPRPA